MRDGSTSLRRLWTLFKAPETWGYLAVLVLCAVSIPAYGLIPPWGGPWGLDLQNLYTFHHCGRDLYAATGRACGDWLGRDMFYPPVLYWSFSWTRPFSFETARILWACFIVLVVAGTAVFWGRLRDPSTRLSVRVQVGIFGLLLLTQYPVTFAIERSNSDVLVLLLWSFALALFLQGRRGLAGALAGLTAVFKLYPAFAAAVVCAGALGMAIRGARPARLKALRLWGGAALVPVVLSLALFDETRTYFTKILPRFAAHLPGVTIYSHSVPATFGTAHLWVTAALVLAWSAVAFFRLEDAPREVFAGALAISTYAAATSFDYNLVTVYPLLLCLLLRALEEERRRSVWDWATLALGLAGVTAHRAWFRTSPTAHVDLQVAWLLASALLVGVRGPVKPAVPQEPGVAEAAPATAG